MYNDCFVVHYHGNYSYTGNRYNGVNDSYNGVTIVTMVMHYKLLL